MIRFGRGAFGVFSILLMLGCSSAGFKPRAESTAYKRWFLDQAGIKCSDCVVGYAMASYYQSSSAESALRDAAFQYARSHFTHFEGGQAFWSTEIGRIWMGNNFTEEFDSTLVEEAMEFLQPVDSMLTENLVAYLYAPGQLELSGGMKAMVDIKLGSPPGWIKNVPDDPGYYYATGVAQSTYYEASAWVEAEKMARKNLAGSIHITIQSLNKENWETQEIQNQEISVILQGLEIAGRWKEPGTNFYHVLIRMPE